MCTVITIIAESYTSPHWARYWPPDWKHCMSPKQTPTEKRHSKQQKRPSPHVSHKDEPACPPRHFGAMSKPSEVSANRQSRHRRHRLSAHRDWGYRQPMWAGCDGHHNSALAGCPFWCPKTSETHGGRSWDSIACWGCSPYPRCDRWSCCMNLSRICH